MSRIGYRKIVLPESVELTTEGNNVTVKGEKGSLTREFSPNIKMNVKDNIVTFEPAVRYSNKVRAMHGTMRANLNNMVEGVTNGFKKTLKLVGVGYRAQAKGSVLEVNVGYSNPVEIQINDDLKVETPDSLTINVSGINKEHVGDFAAKVRAVRSPEPYKGKGIRYEGEVVRRKEGKTGK
ncbi:MULTISPECIES: 50S ribosomal protein L6 [Apilactobacillus]|uniref:Large ribosomal subunit protein uL6 n=2 Tax=Apilactobacillus TaxID=2767877 RepID=A0A2S2JJX1_9LACO|nr:MULTISPECIES: 50S ribosomal protein L6 [Apilactobacillus]TPR14502.1 50S ribosomal protein L6 [Apilactobacillus timberlakei]TPR14619.1 50S ribosomal protein L6 [Apilactobacillus timberlakei]TPR15946.1 50S ribosomal protein L6 [Apilactobacillus timberlakei]TPR18367.1 50S ribosomal protein L6 [Apilactobacillus timberlakei]TPR18687.1 50S ribosomal protein L6 [Apilactobacillus timberlakei]